MRGTASRGTLPVRRNVHRLWRDRAGEVIQGFTASSVARLSPLGDEVERTENLPVDVVGRWLAESEVTPGADDVERTPSVQGSDGLQEVGARTPDLRRDDLARVLRDIGRRFPAVPESLKVDDEAVAGDLIPQVAGDGVGDVLTFKDDVQVRVPLGSVRPESKFEEVNAARHSGLDRPAGPELAEARVEAGDLLGERDVGSPEGQGEEAELPAFDGREQVERDGPPTLASTRVTPSVVAAVASNSVPPGRFGRC